MKNVIEKQPNFTLDEALKQERELGSNFKSKEEINYDNKRNPTIAKIIREDKEKLSECKCSNCGFEAEIKKHFGKPCPKCGEDTITVFLNKRESEIAKTIINHELGGLTK